MELLPIPLIAGSTNFNLFGLTWLVNLSFDSLRLGSRMGYVFALPVEPFQKMMRMWRREITAVTVLSTPVMIS